METQIKVEKGVDLFAKLPDAGKEAILGKAAFLAYKSGAVKLEDSVEQTRDRRWGTTRYARSLGDILGPKERDRWTRPAAEEARQERKTAKATSSYRPPEERQGQREAQLAAMSDEQFASEVRGHQAARWSQSSLINHTRKHEDDWQSFAGRTLKPSDVREYSEAVLKAWDQLFTNLDPDLRVAYTFTSRWSTGGGIIVVVTREGKIRTAIPVSDEKYYAYLNRHHDFVEVTSRAKKLDL